MKKRTETLAPWGRWTYWLARAFVTCGAPGPDGVFCDFSRRHPGDHHSCAGGVCRHWPHRWH
jgi:hypothetical protein